jgi:hypothetical protein
VTLVPAQTISDAFFWQQRWRFWWFMVDTVLASTMSLKTLTAF